MKTKLLIFVTIISTNYVVAQISKTKVVKKENLSTEVKYDSLQNFVGENVYAYLDQELYLKELSPNLREYGYDNFVKDYKYSGYNKKANTYKCCDGFNSKYDDLNGRYFKVIKIFPHPKAEESEYLYGDKYYLELVEKESKDTLYYEYSSQFKFSFPFIVMGFYEKQKENLIGKEFVFPDRTLKVSTGGGFDISTGNPLSIKTGQRWKCKDLTIEDKYYTLALVVENSDGETTTVSYDTAFDERNYAYTSEEADNYIKDFGAENFNLILQGKVKIGMSKKCVNYLGENQKI